MAKKDKMTIVLEQENQKEVEEVMDFLEMLKKNEKKEFLAFLQGAKFVRNLDTA